MEVRQAKNLARLLALFLSWILLVLYFIWGFWRNLSFLTLVWRGLLLFSVAYLIIFYYFLWIISSGGNKETEVKDESNSGD